MHSFRTTTKLYFVKQLITDYICVCWIGNQNIYSYNFFLYKLHIAGMLVQLAGVWYGLR